MANLITKQKVKKFQHKARAAAMIAEMEREGVCARYGLKLWKTAEYYYIRFLPDWQPARYELGERTRMERHLREMVPA